MQSYLSNKATYFPYHQTTKNIKRDARDEARSIKRPTKGMLS